MFRLTRTSFVMFIVAASLGPPFPPPAYAADRHADDLYVITADSRVDTLAAWRALVCVEFEGLEPDRPGSERRAAGPPVAVSALVSKGLVIPIAEVSYIFPLKGVYVLRNGQAIQANPLASAWLNRRHRYLDLDRGGVVLTGDSTAQSGLHPVPARTTIEVNAEYIVSRTVAGHTQDEYVRRPLTETGAVVFEAAALPRAIEDLKRLSEGQPLASRDPASDEGQDHKISRQRD